MEHGLCYVYVWDDGFHWRLKGRAIEGFIMTPQRRRRRHVPSFGSSVALSASGQTVVVGAPPVLPTTITTTTTTTQLLAQEAYVCIYRYEDDTSQWLQIGDCLQGGGGGGGTTGSSSIGDSVAISDDGQIVIVGEDNSVGQTRRPFHVHHVG
eukprot:CAMPEP_0116557718 /NCGR_PEP_ID=MMETSP0397-20121206/9399_1 /TAXON_ID=216820 /ORGANISM="Cyclophora tenuis, Strain ECT3854" /LENGTH=151 /DNA_ID=CAMNT_0004083213 /DNA_START=124 /DNA_END=579 /DNA_ORIENTATION=+